MEKEPLKSAQVSAGGRVYYIDAYTDCREKKYMVISELPTGEFAGKKKRSKIFLHGEVLDRFKGAFEEIAAFILENKN